jgi:hypothetical protein
VVFNQAAVLRVPHAPRAAMRPATMEMLRRALHGGPDRYPVINGPIQLWIKKMKYRAPAGASEGAKFIDMAEKLRATVAHNNDKHRKVRNLAELDSIIWAKYGNE